MVGIQFNLNFDNSILKYSSSKITTNGTPTNFSKLVGSSVNVGSLNTNGSTLDNTTTYKIAFKSNTKIDSILGLISISNAEVINVDGKNLNVKIL